MKKYKFIYFDERPDERPSITNNRTKLWLCRNRKSNGILGTIWWYAPWRQYCFHPEGDTVFSAGCLEDINDFIKTQMKERSK